MRKKSAGSQTNDTVQMLPKIVNLNDDQKVQEFLRILDISEEDSNKIVLAAKSPSTK